MIISLSCRGGRGWKSAPVWRCSLTGNSIQRRSLQAVRGERTETLYLDTTFTLRPGPVRREILIFWYMRRVGKQQYLMVTHYRPLYQTIFINKSNSQHSWLGTHLLDHQLNETLFPHIVSNWNFHLIFQHRNLNGTEYSFHVFVISDEVFYQFQWGNTVLKWSTFSLRMKLYLKVTVDISSLLREKWKSSSEF